MPHPTKEGCDAYPGSHYVFNHQLVSPGTKTYRVLITGGPENLGGASTTVAVTVAPAPAAALTPQTLTTPTPAHASQDAWLRPRMG